MSTNVWHAASVAAAEALDELELADAAADSDTEVRYAAAPGWSTVELPSTDLLQPTIIIPTIARAPDTKAAARSRDTLAALVIIS
ncbi:hypothetical protein MTY66_42590 [Mycolicibacterium sp. TY66]|nr:hypothetical protein MTY66_42590 [Mycolicibacterium sp. TY66]BCJ79719.1 hypothetical protein MTY81_10920 [Mycolicibacterium sp. TY81]